MRTGDVVVLGHRPSFLKKQEQLKQHNAKITIATTYAQLNFFTTKNTNVSKIKPTSYLFFVVFVFFAVKFLDFLKS